MATDSSAPILPRFKDKVMYISPKESKHKIEQSYVISSSFKGILRFLLYLLILGIVYVYLFENNVYPIFLGPYLDYALKKILLFIMIALLSFLIVRFDEIKFILELFFPVLLAYLSVCFVI